MNPALQHLHPYPFEKLRALLHDLTSTAQTQKINLSIGEPQHPVPEFIHSIWQQGLTQLNKYPKTRGSDALRQSISQWIKNRNPALTRAPCSEREILPVSGTREALFSFAQALLDPTNSSKRHVGMPNPFYQIYEGAAIMAGCEPLYINCLPEKDYCPDFSALSEQQWQSMQLLYLCNPSNPTGTSLDEKTLSMLVEKAQKYNFVIASDECYSEIYLEETKAPISLLTVCANMGIDQFDRCVIFNSLSKRSNLAGLRSGFIAGDAKLLAQYTLYRTYHGCTLSPAADSVSAAAWSDEEHVTHNRQRYQKKLRSAYDQLRSVCPLPKPDGGFCLWVPTPTDDGEFVRTLYTEQDIISLPGQYLARSSQGINPGKQHIRIALVAEEALCQEAVARIARQLEQSR